MVIWKKPAIIPPRGNLWCTGSGADSPTIHTGAPSGRATTDLGGETTLIRRSTIRKRIMVDSSTLQGTLFEKTVVAI